jgi:Region found in RelA / SpoT proteins
MCRSKPDWTSEYPTREEAVAALHTLHDGAPVGVSGWPPDWTEFTPMELVEHFGTESCWHSARRLTNSFKIEPGLTDLLMAISPQRTTLVGLDHRIKSVVSTCQKVHRISLEDGCIASTATERVADLLRYTVQADDVTTMVPAVENFSDAARIADLDIIEARHYYVAGSRYKGVHLYLADREQQDVFEVQFHTAPEWAALNGPHHDLYKVYRDVATPPEQARQALAELQRRAALLPHPPELGRLESASGSLAVCGGCKRGW